MSTVELHIHPKHECFAHICADSTVKQTNKLILYTRTLNINHHHLRIHSSK